MSRLHRIWWKLYWSWRAYPEVYWSELSGHHNEFWHGPGAVVVNDAGERIAVIVPRWAGRTFPQEET